MEVSLARLENPGSFTGKRLRDLAQPAESLAAPVTDNTSNATISL
jgi:hypothetical protein